MKPLKYLSFLAALILFVSCEEVVEIDLNSSSPTVVVEGNISAGSTASLHLSYTSDYFSNDQSPDITNAVVTIANSNGESEILKSAGDGQYVGEKMLGEENTTYTISIDLGDKFFEGKSTILTPSSLVKLQFEEATFSRPGGGSHFGADADSLPEYNIHIQFTDDLLQENYYMLRIRQGDSINDFSSSLYQDKFYEDYGMISIVPMMYNFKEGDMVNVKIYTIDFDTYNFYNQLSDVSGGGMGMMMMGTPYNPSSNLGKNVLDYFAAWAIIDTTFIVKS